MKKTLMLFIILFFAANTYAQFTNFYSSRVSYFESSVSNIQFKRIGLRDGSQWRFSSPIMVSNYSKIFIVLDETETQGVAYINSIPYDIKYISGDFFSQQGILSKAINKYKDGKRIMLEDQSEWDVPDEEDAQSVIAWNMPSYAILSINKEYIIEPSSQIRIKINFVEKKE